ncbi:hypothetical protein Pst134EA_030434 [Puccinia striiformis f. sp. tritici]|uniref:hypothetical protein n=2 Tax=Puccinia striiformis f. sp. tritici TaxID=168172 RepID=UPI002008D620|nr:hypothetical protein Pst134EA_030434 [Puccinia striiformis f. sp. tritici]KAH9446520.1 hypothetical protein Pst134EA_030434 [Puccinia striiformis f. sp. tritici]
MNIHDVYDSKEINNLQRFINKNNNRKSATIIINRRDGLGRTIAHRLASSRNQSQAIQWLDLLSTHSLLQSNLQDLESGWTPLHRALYLGNLRFAKLLIEHSESDLTTIKDHEALTAFDLYHSTIDRSLLSTAEEEEETRTELFTWGSNRNFVLGIDDDGDRHYPERIHLRQTWHSHNPFISTSIKAVKIGKLHTALITSRGELRVCGFGSGGRLGLITTKGSQFNETQFKFVPVRTGGLGDQKVTFVGLAQDHTMVITHSGQVYTFGFHRGQLGYPPEPTSSSSSSSTSQNLIQEEPKRVLGLLKKVLILGGATSRYHTAVYSSDSLFTWGVNRGQLGYTSTETQVLPRKVPIPSTTKIIQLSCTDSVTAYLTAQAGEVYILKSDTVFKLNFPFDRFPIDIKGALTASSSSVTQIDSYEQTLAAVSSMGDVYIVDLDIPTENSHPRSSLKPRRIWCSSKSINDVNQVAVGADGDLILSTHSGEVYIGHARKSSLSASRPIDSCHSSKNHYYKFHKVHHLNRVSKVSTNSTGSFAVVRNEVNLLDIRPSSPNETVSLASLLANMLDHLRKYSSSVPELISIPFDTPSKVTPDLDSIDDEEEEEEEDDDMVWDCRVGLTLFNLSLNWSDFVGSSTSADLYLVASNGHKIPVHKFIIASRSIILDQILNDLIEVDGIIAHTSGDGSGLDQIRFEKFDTLSLLILVHFLYTDKVPHIWDRRVSQFILDHRNPSIPNQTVLEILRTLKPSLILLASLLNLINLEKSMINSSFELNTLSPDLGIIFSKLNEDQSGFLEAKYKSLRPDVRLDLKDGEFLLCHSILLCSQSPFFNILLDDKNLWIINRRSSTVTTTSTTTVVDTGDNNLKMDCWVCIDMNHLHKNTVNVVLRHIYTDLNGDQLFNPKDFDGLNDYIDFVFEVMAVANEFLMDKLKFICSVVLRRCINLSNVTSIAIEAEFYRADSLKETCMDFILSNLDIIFQDKGLIKIPDDLLDSISIYLKKLQSKKFPISRSRSAAAVNVESPKSTSTLTTLHWKSLHKSLSENNNQQDERVSRGSIQSNCSSSISPPSDLLPTRIRSDPTILDSSYSTTSNGTPAKTLEPVNETVDEEEDVQFAMDDFDEAEEVGKGLSKLQLNPSNECSSSAWATPIKKVTPIDLRTVVSLSGKQQQRGLGDFSSSPRLPSDLMSPNQKLSQREKRRQSAEAFKSKPDSSLTSSTSQNKGPAWRSISTGNDRSSSTTPLSCSPSSSKLPIQKLHAKAGVVPTPKIPEPIADPASAVGATVITPTRASNGIASSNSSRRTVAGQDRPWTNYLSTTSAPLNPSTHPTVSIPILSPSFLVDQSLNHLSPGTSLDTITTTNFSIIQERQAKESYLLFGPGKLKPQLAQIQEDEQRRLIEKKQEEDFLKWFEDESARLQQQQQQAHSSRSNTKLKSKKSNHHVRKNLYSSDSTSDRKSTPKDKHSNNDQSVDPHLERNSYPTSPVHVQPSRASLSPPLTGVSSSSTNTSKRKVKTQNGVIKASPSHPTTSIGSSSRSTPPCTHKSTLLHRQQQQQQKQQKDLLRPSLSVKSSTVHSHNPSSSSSSSSSTVKAN